MSADDQTRIKSSGVQIFDIWKLTCSGMKKATNKDTTFRSCSFYFCSWEELWKHIVNETLACVIKWSEKIILLRSIVFPTGVVQSLFGKPACKICVTFSLYQAPRSMGGTIEKENSQIQRKSAFSFPDPRRFYLAHFFDRLHWPRAWHRLHVCHLEKTVVLQFQKFNLARSIHRLSLIMIIFAHSLRFYSFRHGR